MKNLKIIGKLILGISISVGAQWLSFIFFLILPVEIQRLDPFLNFSYDTYNSIGLAITVIGAILVSFRKKWPLAIGILLGLALWFPVLTTLLSIEGL